MSDRIFGAGIEVGIESAVSFVISIGTISGRNVERETAIVKIDMTAGEVESIGAFQGEYAAERQIIIKIKGEGLNRFRLELECFEFRDKDSLPEVIIFTGLEVGGRFIDSDAQGVIVFKCGVGDSSDKVPPAERMTGRAGFTGECVNQDLAADALITFPRDVVGIFVRDSEEVISTDVINGGVGVNDRFIRVGDVAERAGAVGAIAN